MTCSFLRKLLELDKKVFILVEILLLCTYSVLVFRRFCLHLAVRSPIQIKGIENQANELSNDMKYM